MTRTLLGDAAPVVDAVTGMLESVFTAVASIRDELADCFRRCGADAPTTRDVRAVEDPTLPALREGAGLIRGAGVVPAPRVLLDARLWTNWWTVDTSGTVAPAVFDLDEDSLDFYDYISADWFLVPRGGAERSLIGPYVDVNGINDYTVTATIPVRVEDRFVAVAGVDVSVGEFERRLGRANRTLRAELVVLNTADRIVASTCPRHLAGSLLHPAPEAKRLTVHDGSWTIVVVED